MAIRNEDELRICLERFRGCIAAGSWIQVAEDVIGDLADALRESWKHVEDEGAVEYYRNIARKRQTHISTDHDKILQLEELVETPAQEASRALSENEFLYERLDEKRQQIVDEVAAALAAERQCERLREKLREKNRELDKARLELGR